MKFKHEEEDIWDAIGVDYDKLQDKLNNILEECIDDNKNPSERIELLSKKLNKVELASVILMLETDLIQIRSSRRKQHDIAYM